MNANMRKWIDALRSGEYEQARLKLRQGDAFCCLGVACEVYRCETGDGGWTEGGAFETGDTEERSRMPATVAQWFGLDLGDPKLDYRQFYPGRDAASCASNWNDAGATFNEIADALEAEYGQRSGE